MKKQDIIHNLEMDQMEYLDSLLSQLQDNIDDVDISLRKYEKTKDRTDLMFFINDFQRLRTRNDSVFNLSKKLLSEIDANVKAVRSELYKLEVKDD